MNLQFSQLLLAWYENNARKLPWRGNPDPYAVWVSEIMLQQTRVDTVIPYFDRWLRQFPDIQSLSAAPLDVVLRAWEGLGYYSRARAMHHTAQLLSENSGSQLPKTYTELLALPGIGKYSAAAISSIAFNQDYAVVDGNVKRVLARVFNLELPINLSSNDHCFQELASELLPPGKASEYNQAIMDLGAIVCTPRNPLCQNCPLSSICESYKSHLQSARPVIMIKPAIPHYTVVAGVLRKGSRVLISRRPLTGLLGGLWEFPGGKVESGESSQQALVRELEEELGIKAEIGDLINKYKHAYTHFKVTLSAYQTGILRGDPLALESSEIRWVETTALRDYPMGKIDRMISNDLEKLIEGK